jgi:hypothetical protein
MSCREWEESIALLVDGETAATGLAEHLAGCGGCSQLLEDLRADQQKLQTAPEIGSVVCEVVREEALRRVARRGIGWGRWTAAAAVAAALLVAGIWRRPEVPVSHPIEVKPQARAAPVIEEPAHTAPKARRRLRQAKAPDVAPRDADWERAVAEWFPSETRRQRRGSPSEVAMQIQTSDPDVVILWLKEERLQ